eukprot:312947-Pelagomonas_calceolata.AAC.1
MFYQGGQNVKARTMFCQDCQNASLPECDCQNASFHILASFHALASFHILAIAFVANSKDRIG